MIYNLWHDPLHVTFLLPVLKDDLIEQKKNNIVQLLLQGKDSIFKLSVS